MDQVGAQHLQQRPGHPAGDRAGEESPARNALGSENAEAGEIQPDIRQDREHPGEDDDGDRLLAIGIQAGEQGGNDHA